MSAAARRIDINDLGEPARKLIREVHDSGDEVMLVDGAEEMAVMRPAAAIRGHETAPEWDDWDQADRDAWRRLLAIRADVTTHWASKLSGAEAIEEQRR